ncbi:hypothetical protein [Marinobacter gelidimuriae]|uniref:hypothetical protein n=1 Tax=Marinobacter gelidimuriae TaxID=2739064 RepID=UPI00037BC42C|nr:hypothetical protein [Marinobacter gelidimuriae]
MLEALNVESEKDEIRREIRAINRLRKRLFGDLESKEDAYMRTAKRTSVSDRLKLAHTQ